MGMPLFGREAPQGRLWAPHITGTLALTGQTALTLILLAWASGLTAAGASAGPSRCVRAQPSAPSKGCARLLASTSCSGARAVGGTRVAPALALLVLSAWVSVAAGLEACPAAGGEVVSPCAVAPTCNVSAVGTGYRHTCALLSHGGVRCVPAPPSSHTGPSAFAPVRPCAARSDALAARAPQVLGAGQQGPAGHREQSHHGRRGRRGGVSCGRGPRDESHRGAARGRIVPQLRAVRQRTAVRAPPLSPPWMGCVSLA